jgi:hypothetical protein
VGSLMPWDQVLSGGRFLVDQPEINPNDSRMTPNTYLGGNLARHARRGSATSPPTLNAIKPRNSEDFINFAAVADIGARGPPGLHTYATGNRP